MDREDARFVARVLESRIAGDRAELDELAASSLMRLSAIATTIDQNNSEFPRWRPATAAADELMEICRQAGKLADQPLEDARVTDLEIFITKMRELADEPPMAPANRHERRRKAKLLLPRSKRLVKASALTLGDLGRLQ